MNNIPDDLTIRDIIDTMNSKQRSLLYSVADCTSRGVTRLMSLAEKATYQSMTDIQKTAFWGIIGMILDEKEKG